jgi:hypothetical protein
VYLVVSLGGRRLTSRAPAEGLVWPPAVGGLLQAIRPWCGRQQMKREGGEESVAVLPLQSTPIFSSTPQWPSNDFEFVLNIRNFLLAKMRQCYVHWK